jgi:hypothetical protein
VSEVALEREVQKNCSTLKVPRQCLFVLLLGVYLRQEAKNVKG